jgi:P-type Cu2+ transporter
MTNNHSNHDQKAVENSAHRHEPSSNPPMGRSEHDHHRMMIADFRQRFWLSTVLTVPILLLSPLIQRVLGFDWRFAGDTYLLLGLSSVVFFYGGLPFLKGALDEFKKNNIGMMTLIALAICAAYFYSAAVALGLPGEGFFWELVTLIDIMLLGHWLEMKSILGASKALQLLVSMMPAEAHRIDGDKIEDIKLEELQKGDLILIRPGEKVPADGVVVDGESYLNESMLTGESKPVKKEKSSQVIGGSLNGNGSLQVRVEHTGKDSYLSKVIKLVEEAQKTKSRTQHLADRAAKVLTFIAIFVGFGTLVVWLLLGASFNFALERMVTVMIISCPHALGLAVPLVVAISTAVSAQHGLLIRNRTAFENARRITAMIFDKTGTLTKGEFGVTRIESLNAAFDETGLLKRAASLEQNSEHPIAVGITHKAEEKGIEIPRAEEFQAITGKGIEARVEGEDVKVVSPGFLRDKNIQIPAGAYSDAAETVVFVLVNGELAGFIALSDEIRDESAASIQEFKRQGIKVLMATGDNEIVAKAVADKLKLDGYYAEVLPHQKVELVKQLQEKGEFVSMTGDGVNDAPALAQADIGIAVGSGTDIAAETADIILVNSNPRDILNLILFGRATYRKMVQNLLWATGYNVIAIPLAAGVLYQVGVYLTPAIAAVFMSTSTIIVAINAQLLKKQI